MTEPDEPMSEAKAGMIAASVRLAMSYVEGRHRDEESMPDAEVPQHGAAIAGLPKRFQDAYHEHWDIQSCHCVQCDALRALAEARVSALAYLCAECGAPAYGDDTSIDSGTTLTCDRCGGKTVVELHTVEGYFASGKLGVALAESRAREQDANEHAADFGADAQRLERERDAEVEKRQAAEQGTLAVGIALQGCQESRTRVERDNAELMRLHEALVAERDALKAEVGRLRPIYETVRQLLEDHPGYDTLCLYDWERLAELVKAVDMSGLRYLCERCGGTGIQPKGSWDGQAYTGPAGRCQLCGGSGRLGLKPEPTSPSIASATEGYEGQGDEP